MADPISIPASAIALASVAVAAGRITKRYISDYRNAPAELLALSNEVADLGLVLGEARLATVVQSAEGNSANNIEDLLSRAKVQLEGLEELAQQLAPPNQDSMRNIDRLRWHRAKKKAIARMEAIRSIRSSLAVILSARSTYGLSFRRNSLTANGTVNLDREIHE